MCLIVVKPKTGILHKRELREAFRCNRDGAGFMYNANGKLHVCKGYFGFRKLYHDFRAAERENKDSTFVLHFRIATTGPENVLNCHPFMVNDGVGFCHNGVMMQLGNKEISDSADLAYNYLYRLPDDFLNNEKIRGIIERLAACTSSKFAFLDKNGQHVICNESSGHWKDGVWFSNSSYVVLKPVVYPTHSWYGKHWSGSQQGSIVNFSNYEECAVCGAYKSKDWMYEFPGKDGKPEYVCLQCSLTEDNNEIDQSLLLPAKCGAGC